MESRLGYPPHFAIHVTIYKRQEKGWMTLDDDDDCICFILCSVCVSVFMYVSVRFYMGLWYIRKTLRKHHSHLCYTHTQIDFIASKTLFLMGKPRVCWFRINRERHISKHSNETFPHKKNRNQSITLTHDERPDGTKPDTISNADKMMSHSESNVCVTF